QTRAAKRSAVAALRIAIDLVHEGVIAPAQALDRLAGLNPDALARTRLDAPGEPVLRGIGGAPGVATGRAAFDSESAARRAALGDPVILVRPETSTADVSGLAVAAGIVTAQGGRTAHAALVARQMGKPCVVACKALTIDAPTAAAHYPGGTIGEGDWISMDGDNGAVYLGRSDIVRERPAAELAELERWRSEQAAPISGDGGTTSRSATKSATKSAAASAPQRRRHAGARNVRQHTS
ncbi:MAG: hypothetical protein J2P53_08710, partial [Bradyrhizobiaceae bacterium]|nr:hypothetical protein [Bradyrhizobiaceae bacterium]